MNFYIDPRTREYLYDHGASIAADGKITIPRVRFNRISYKHKSLRDPSVWAWMVPTENGVALIFEGKHFRIED